MRADLPEPPPIPADVLMAVYAAVGELVIGWALAEQMLDHMVTLCFHGAGAKTERELPVALTRKLRYLRKCFARVPSLPPFRERASNLLDETEKLSDIRHTVIHGAISDYDTTTETIIFVKLKAVKDRHWVDPRRVKGTALLAAGGEAADLGSRLGDLARGLFDTLVPENVRDKLRRDLGR
jgi:hypothetical protein